MQENNHTVDARTMRNLVPLAVWTVVWLATLAVARFGPEQL